MVFRRATHLAVLLVLLCPVVSAPLLAQTAPGTIKGTVVDKDGQPLPGATITLENPSLGMAQMGGITNPQGEFRITPVPPGKGFILRAFMPGYQKIDFRDIEIPAGRTIVQNITLRPEYKEVVRVAGKEDVVQTEKTSTSTTITSEFITGLPVLGKDYQDVLTLAPGVTDVDNTGNPNIHGARDTDVVTLVDGVSTTDPFTGQRGQDLNSESIEEIEVITSGASAEYSRAQGGFVNIITKSGGNEFKGSFSMALRTQKLDQQGAGIDSPDLRGGLGETGGFRNLKFQDIYPFLSVGGAFVKDKLWYYFAPEYAQVQTPTNAGTQAFVQTTLSARLTSKVTWQVAANNKLAFIGIYDNTKLDNQGLDSLHELSTAFQYQHGGPTLTIQDNALFNSRLYLESTISRYDQHQSITPQLNPDTNHNGILTVDNRPDLGGNGDGFIQLRERDPGDDFDDDGKFDVFEDFNHNGKLDGCFQDPILNQRICPSPSGVDVLFCDGGLRANQICHSNGDCPGGTCTISQHLIGEDRDQDGRLTGKFGCEGHTYPWVEDINCNGVLDREYDLNNDGKVDGCTNPDGTIDYNLSTCEDKGIPCNNPALCPNGYVPGTRGNGKFDTEDKNGNGYLDDTPYPNWVDRNHNGIPDAGEFTAPLPPDQQYVLSLNNNRRTGPYFFNNNDSRTRDSIKEDFSFTIPDMMGNHDVKMGMVWEKEGYDSNLEQRPIWQIRLGSIDQNTGNTGGIIAAFLPTQEVATNTASSNNMGFYLQDNYKPLPNVTLGLGVRFDREAVSSHGFEFFDPAAQRRQYNDLAGLKGVEQTSGDAAGNADGILDAGLTADPLYPGLNNEYKSLESSLGQAAVRVFTRHNFLTSIESEQLKALGIDDPNLLRNGRPRQPQDFTITNNNLAPRLSVSWDPWADGKSKATATWGRFYDKLFLQTVIAEEGPDLLSPYYGYDANGVDSNGLPDNKVGQVISKSPPSAYQIDRNLKTPFTDEMTVGFTREIAPEVSISVNYIHRKFRDQLQDVDVNHTIRTNSPSHPCHTNPAIAPMCDDFGFTTLVPQTQSGGSGDAGKLQNQRQPDGYPDLYINNFNFNQILRIGNYNYQEYEGYEMALSRRLSRKWSMEMNYTFSRTTGQAESFTSESGNDPSVTELKNGYLTYDIRHLAQFAGTAYLPGDWLFTGRVVWHSGLPFSDVNRFSSSDNVDFPQTRRLYGYRELNSGLFIPENRNIHRNHAVYRIDLHGEKKLVIGKTTAAAYLDIQNLLNTDDLRVFEIDNTLQSLQAIETRDFGRRYQLGFRMDF